MSIAKAVRRTLFPAIALAFAMNVHAEPAQADHRLGDHPAVVVQRLHAQQQGPDYAATFYPHPAWLYLRLDAPQATVAQPTVAQPLAQRGS